MKKKVILHIGRHKTGTTGIQLYLASQSQALAEAGYCYPLTGRDQSEGQSRENRAAHHGLALSLMGPRETVRKSLAALRPAFLAEVRGAHTVILSSEAFQNTVHTDLVAEFLEGFEIETICYMREYLAYAASSYAQEIKGSGLVVDFDFFEAKFGLDIRSFIDRWSRISRRSTWRLYDRSRLVDGDVVTDFLASLGLPLPPPPPSSDPNRSISGSLLGFKLILNTLGLHHRNLGYAMDDLAGAHSRFRGQFHIPAERQAILRRRNSCNELLRGLFGDVPEYDFENGNRIFDPATLREDMELIVHEFMRYPEVATHPLFADRAPADVALGVLQPTRT